MATTNKPRAALRQGAKVKAVRRPVALVEPEPAPEPTEHRGRLARRAAAGARHRWGRRVASAALGTALVAGGAYAATSWIVGLNSGSSGEGQAASVSNLTITAVATPSPTNQLYPGGTGDVVLTITNPNSFPVTLTSVSLPANTSYAQGYTTSALSTTQTGCSTTTSIVTWAFATGTSGTSHTLSSALVIGPSGNANDPLTVTLTNDASMGSAAPAACEATFFSMPSFTGVTATGGAGTVTSSPATDAWTA